MSRKAWTENVEKVVKPPRNPTPAIVRRSSLNTWLDTKTPSKNDPPTLIPTVAHGNADPWKGVEIK